MGSFANTLFTIMLGWLQNAVWAIWNAFTNENGGSFLRWVGDHWKILAAILCVIGVLTDLSVYIFRWRPYLVWKRIFRPRNPENGQNPETDSAAEKASSFRYFRQEEPEDAPDEREERFPTRQAESFRRPVFQQEAPDLTRWDHPGANAPAPEETEEREPLITSAGYTVPADSPYRRPREQAPAKEDTEPRDQRREAVNLKPRRRRRVFVSELLSDPEEELQEFDAPQKLIDRQQAYHEPVYPRGWKKEEGGAE